MVFKLLATRPNQNQHEIKIVHWRTGITSLATILRQGMAHISMEKRWTQDSCNGCLGSCVDIMGCINYLSIYLYSIIDLFIKWWFLLNHQQFVCLFFWGNGTLRQETTLDDHLRTHTHTHMAAGQFGPRIDPWQFTYHGPASHNNFHAHAKHHKNIYIDMDNCASIYAQEVHMYTYRTCIHKWLYV